jgi:hypothetical protein
MLNAFIFPGLGYFLIGKKFRGSLIVLATCYFIFLPLLRFTHTVFSLISPANTGEMMHPRLFSAMSFSFSAHLGLIIWSLVGIITLWIVGILDLWLKMKKTDNERSQL